MIKKVAAGILLTSILLLGGIIWADAGSTNTWVGGLGGTGYWTGSATKRTNLNYVEAIHLSNDGDWNSVQTWIVNESHTALTPRYVMYNLANDSNVRYTALTYSNVTPASGTKLTLGVKNDGFNLRGASVQHYVYWK